MNKLLIFLGFIFLALFVASLFAKVKISLKGFNIALYEIKIIDIYKALITKPATKSGVIRATDFIDISVGF